MLMSVDEASQSYPRHILRSPSLAELYSQDRSRNETERPTLLVLKEGVMSAALRQRFSKPDWAPTLLSELIMPNGHGWQVADPSGKLCAPEPDLIDQVKHNAGVAGRPRGNAHCCWEIRSYQERNSDIGGMVWWREIVQMNASRKSVAFDLVEAVLGFLEAANKEGGSVFVEQLSIILAKDPEKPIRSLTPTLHADEFYGVRETAITSILEEGWSPHGGALFLPTADMESLWERRPIYRDAVQRDLSHLPCVWPNSGDVLIYDGMMDAVDNVDRRSGIPHISADEAGQSARLAILMRHQPPSQLTTP